MKTQITSKQVKHGLAAFWALLVLLQGALAGVPFNNLQGAGGAAFNPLAYPAGQNAAEGETSPISKPQFGAWYVNLGDVDVDWTTFGAAVTAFKRLELSYGYELIAPAGENVKKSNVGAKLNLIPENWGGRNYVPAVSAGTIWKSTSEVAEGADDSAFDFYVVATKLITQLPRPVLVSAVVLNTKEQVTGVFGYNDDSDTTFFANVDVLPTSFLALGAEFKQGAEYSSFKNESYYDLHAAWFVNPNLTLIGAYVNAGDEKSETKAGLGDGAVLSAQYAF